VIHSVHSRNNVLTSLSKKFPASENIPPKINAHKVHRIRTSCPLICTSWHSVNKKSLTFILLSLLSVGTDRSRKELLYRINKPLSTFINITCNMIQQASISLQRSAFMLVIDSLFMIEQQTMTNSIYLFLFYKR